MMSKEPLKTLCRQWVENQLETSRAVGQMLRHLLDQERRILRIERELQIRDEELLLKGIRKKR